jgi:hypothetical protein
MKRMAATLTLDHSCTISLNNCFRAEAELLLLKKSSLLMESGTQLQKGSRGCIASARAQR